MCETPVLKVRAVNEVKYLFIYSVLSAPSGCLLQLGGQVCRHRQGAHHQTYAADGWTVWHL